MIGDFGTGYRPDDDAHRVTDEHAGKMLTIAPVSAGTFETDNRALFNPPRRNQKKSNFCVRFAMDRALRHLAARKKQKDIPFSPLFMAWNDAMPGDQGYNVGTQIYLSAQAATKYGVCSDDAYPFEISPDDYLTRMKWRPNGEAYREAERHQMTESLRIENGDWLMMAATLQRGIGFVFGMPIRESALKVMNPAKGGIIDNSGGKIIAYHAMYVIDAKIVGGQQHVEIDGSWAEENPLLLPVGKFGTDEFTDIRVVVDQEEVK